MGIRTKILSAFFIMTIMLVLAGVWTIYEVRSVGSTVEQFLDENYRSITAAKSMIESLEREDSATLLLLLGRWDEGREILEKADALFLDAAATARGNITIPGEEQYVQDVEDKYKAYKAIWSRPIVDTSRQGDIAWYHTTLHPAFAASKEAARRLMSLNDQTMYTTALDLKSRTRRTLIPGIVAIAAALALTMLLNFFVNLYLVTPIIRITKGVRAFMDESKSYDVMIETDDELRSLNFSIRDALTMIKQQGR